MSGQTAEHHPGTAKENAAPYVCAECRMPVRFDEITFAFYHDPGPGSRQYGTIAREVKPA